LEPEAGLKNDAMFNYIGTLITKLQDGEKLSGPENLIMDKLLDQVDDSAHISADESIEEGDFGSHFDDHSGTFDSFIRQFIDEFDPAEMFAANSDDIANITPEDASEYFVDATLRDKDVADIKHTIGWYAQKCWNGSEEGENLKDLTDQDEQHIIKAVWPKVVKYLESKGLKLAVEEGQLNEFDDPAAEFHNGAVACEQGVGRDANPHEEGTDEYEYWDSGWEKQAGQDRASHMSDIADRFGDEAADHLYDDVAVAVHPAMVDGPHVATDFGPGKIIDSIPGGVKVELQNGQVIEVPEGEFDVVENRIREEAELDAWFEGFDPATVLAPIELDEYELNKDEARLATGDRVVPQEVRSR
jgi:hypothetical protein